LARRSRSSTWLAMERNAVCQPAEVACHPDVQKRVLVSARSAVTYDRPYVTCMCAPSARSSELPDRCGNWHHRRDVTPGGTGQLSGIMRVWGRRRSKTYPVLYGIRIVSGENKVVKRPEAANRFS
jgi:hypothetical protein